MIREIKRYPNPILRKKALPIKKIDDKIREIAFDMCETLNAYNAFGLAGNQIGVLKRIIVVRIKESPFVIINPKIISSSYTEEAEEGCLSFPGLFVNIQRQTTVVFRGIDMNGSEIEGKVEGLSSRAIQHEIDHLDGILFIDRIKKEERKMVLSKWRNYSCKE